jgi:soluble lytic murein transglycosylase
MKPLFLIFLTLCLSLAVAQDADSGIELELLTPYVFKNEVLRRELALQGIESTKDSFSRELLRASVFYYDKKWDSAYSAYMPLLEKAPNFLHGPLTIRIAKCELERGNIQASRKILLSIKSIKTELNIEQYKKLLDSMDYNAVWMQNMLRIVRNTGNKKEANEMKNANNLWAKALGLEQVEKYNEAIAVYKQLCDPKFGKALGRQWAKFRVGLINFKEGKYAEAADIFAEAAKENLGLMPRNAALYFYAECQRMLANKDSLAKAYNAVIADFPLGYYSWRAKHILREFELSSIPVIGTEMTDSAAIAWLRALQKKEANEKDSVSIERLELFSVLLRCGFEKEVFTLYKETFERHKNHPEFYYRCGIMFMQNGEYALAHRLARIFLDFVPVEKMAGIPIQVLKFLYPLPYEAKVRKHVKIDHFLVYSVMRQESIFDASITSTVGARGLLQIMPATGDFLAKSESIKKYNDDLLYNPYMNIRLGVRYLNDLHAEYEGDYIGVLGNYNAGPAPAARWVANYSSLPWDIRVEEVGYWETRDYVKRVMGNYWTYKELYGEN